MENCLFCKIIDGTIPSKKIFENEFLFAFEDIAPQAPVHILIIPKIHTPNLSETTNAKTLSELLLATTEIAKSLQLSDYRIVINNGEQAGQTVFHLHLHLLSGRRFSWPPG